MKGILKFFLFLLGIPILFLIGVLGVSVARYGLPYTYRALVYNDSGIDDFNIFPTRAIQNEAPVFDFAKPDAPLELAPFSYQFQRQIIQVSDPETFLADRQTVAFIIVKDDKILYENYFNGYQRDSLISIFSVSKSITSTLIGFAVEDGYIASIDDSVARYIPELEERGMDKFTIRDLLLMNSGIPYNQDDEAFFLFQIFYDDALNYYMPDLRKYALSMRVNENEIGKAFIYNNHHPLFEGMILERVTGKSVSAYTEEKLWKPLGMEFPASWNLDSEKSGFEHMESGFNARAIDFARFGRLFLNKGNWNGEQVISEQWVLEATSPDVNDNRLWAQYPDWPEYGGYYKYHWWGLKKPDGSYVFAARGHLGQVIYINPAKNIIIVRAGKKGKAAEWMLIADAVAGTIR